MITKSDTPNGRHSLETVSHQSVEESHTIGKSVPDSELERPSPPEERSHNGVTSIEENQSTLQEADLILKETDVKEVKESKLEAETRVATTPPPPIVTPASSLPPPPRPPSLVQSSDLHNEPKSENKATVRTAPPALVGCETLDKEACEERPEDEEGMEFNDDEGHSVDATQLVGEGNHMKQDEVGGDIDDSAQQQLQQQAEEHQQDVNEESPGLVIDTGCQPGTEDEIHVGGEPETEEHRKSKELAVNLATDSSQVLSYEGMKGGRPIEPCSPQSITSNEEDVDLEMDIIEEGEEEGGTPPPLPPPIPRGTLMKAPTASAASTISQAHIQSLSSAHSRIGVSPSHTANRLALENLKNRDSVRKPNVIVSSPSSSGSSVLDLSRSGGGSNSGKEGSGNDSGRDRQSVVTDNFRVRQVAKVKQFFTALQQFSNKRGSEVAEQVQELITAVVVSIHVLAIFSLGHPHPHPLSQCICNLIPDYTLGALNC